MQKWIPFIVAFIALPAGELLAQNTTPPVVPMAADANPIFAVATIKPSTPDERGKRLGMQGHRFITTNTTLADLIVFACGIHSSQLVGEPAWLRTDNYNVVAEPEAPGQPSIAQMKLMVQKLLADRIQLTLHRDKKELSVYTITVAPKGPKLTESHDDPNGPPGSFGLGRGILRVTNTSVADLAGLMLVMVLDRPILDRTGLTGRYDLTLKWTPDEFQFGGAKGEIAAAAADAPDIFTAMQEQLGLKLESTKAEAEVFVVDRAEKPSEN